MDNRKLPESNPSPEFIKVSYDRHGNPIDVTPVSRNEPKETNGKQTRENSARPIPQPIEEWLVLISKNIISLKRDLEDSRNNFSQIIQESRNSSIDLSPLNNSINSANYRIDLLGQKTDSATYQLNLITEMIASFAKELSQHQAIDNEFAQKIENLNEQLNGNFVSLRQILKSIEMIETDTNQKFNFVDERIASMHRQLASSIERTEGNIVALNGIMNEINEKIDSFETSNFEIQVSVQNSLQNMKQELMQEMEKNRIDRETLIQEVVERIAKRMKKIMAPKVEIKVRVRKHRKTKHKIQKRKVNKKVSKINKNILAKKLMKARIQTYPSALVVTERRMQKIGRTVFDVAKNLNKNVLMIMQDKMSESDGFEPITYDAMLNSDAIFLVTKKNMKKNFSLKTVKAQKSVFIVNQKVKFSKLS